jgi:hypothetical protein
MAKRSRRKSRQVTAAPHKPATRLDDLKDLLGNLFLPFAGAVMLGFGVVMGRMTVEGLRRGWFDEGDAIVYVAREPVWFWISTAFLAAMALGCGWLGVQMLLEGWRERRHSARLVRRLLDAERGGP